MISSIKGIIQDIDSSGLIVEVGGVGLQIHAPAPTLDGLRRGEVVSLYTSLIVREDSLTLYGFETREGRNYFELLLGVNGVGPRLALAVLSTLSTDAIRRGVFHEQAELFSRVPGVGKRTAQKILMHLQDRLPGEAGLEPVAAMSSTDEEVLAALAALGYSLVEAQAAVQAIPKDAVDDVEERLRIALKYFSA